MVGMSSNLVFGPPSTPECCQRGDLNVGQVLSHHSEPPCVDLTKYEHPECQDIPFDQWWVSEKKALEYGPFTVLYCRHGGFVREYYDRDGQLLEQVFLDEEENQAKSTQNWTGKYWFDNGVLCARSKGFPDGDLSDEDKQMIYQAVKENNQGFIFQESFHPDGTRHRIEYCCIREGEIYRLLESWDEDGELEGYFFKDLEGNCCSPENMATFLLRFGDGGVETKYYVVRDGKRMLHRTDGPALSIQYSSEEEQGRYFLEGAEYTKAEWEKKVGNV